MARTTPVNSGYTIINGVTRGTNVTQVDTWIEYKVLSQSIATNSSQVRAILYSQARRTASTQQMGTPRQYGYVQIDGGTKYYLSTTFTFENHTICKFADHTFTVTHNTNGTKSITIHGDFDISAYVGPYLTGGSAQGTVTLPTIPQYATITQTLSSRTETSITMAWSTDQTVDRLWYSSDNGSTWSSAISVNATSGAFAITGLTANTTYQIKTRVRNKSSQLTSDSSALSVATYQYPYCSSMPNFNLGDSVTLGFYNPLGREIVFKVIGANNIELTPEWTITGTTYTGLNSMNTTVPQLYEQIPNSASGVYKVKVTYGTSVITKTGGTYSAKASDCSPAIGSFTYADVNQTSVAITEDSSKIVRNISTVRYTVGSLTTMYGATVSSVSVKVNNITYALSVSGGSYVGGNASIDSGSNVTAVATVTDSRGFTATKNVTVTMLDWSLPSALISLARQNNYYSETDITVDAIYSSIGGKNQITITYKAKKQGTSTWTVTGTLQDNVQSTFVADNQYVWDVQVVLVDSFGGTTTYNLTIQRGMPLIFFDRLRSGVGINCFPSSNGTLYLNNRDLDKGFRTYRATYLPSGADLNDYAKAGTYSCTSNAIGRTLVNSPEQTGFIMFVYNSIGNTPTDLDDGGVSRYFIQEITSWQGHKWIREIHINSSGNKTIGTWHKLIDTGMFVASEETVVPIENLMSIAYKAQIFEALEYVKTYKSKNASSICLCQFNDCHGYINSPDETYVGFKGQEPNYLAIHGADVIDKMIFCGDTATQATPAEYPYAKNFILGATNIDRIFAMGNHEYGFYNTYNVENPEAYFKDVINVDAVYSGLKKDADNPEALIYYHDDGGVRYIVLNYYYINQTVDTTQMLFDTAQQNWLCSVLASAGSKDIVIIGHTLIYPYMFLHNGEIKSIESQYMLINQDKLISIINAYRNRGTYGTYNFSSCTGDFIMYTSGHYHVAGKSTGVSFNALVGAPLNRKATGVNGFNFYIIDKSKKNIQMLVVTRESDYYQKYVFTY